MRIWKLERLSDNPKDYDESIAFIIRAKSEVRAREIAHEESGDTRIVASRDQPSPEGWLDSSRTSCSPIAVSGAPCVLLQSILHR